MADSAYDPCPMTKRRHINWSMPSSVQLYSIGLTLVSALSALRFPPFSALLFVVGMILSCLPFRGRFLCERLWSYLQSLRLRRLGGYYFRGSLSVNTWVNGNEILSYELPAESSLAVLRNRRRSKHEGMIFLRLNSLAGSFGADSKVTQGKAVELNQVMTEIGRRLTRRFSLFSMFRPDDPSEMDRYLEQAGRSTTELQDYLDFLQSQAGERIFCLAVVVPIGRKDQTLLKTERRFQVPALRIAHQALTLLRGIGIHATAMESHELSALRWLAYEPTNARETWKILDSDLRPGEARLISRSMTSQRPLTPETVQVGRDWLRVGDSFHACLETTRFTVGEMPPGLLTELMSGVSYWSICSLRLAYESSKGAARAADMQRRWQSGRLLNRQNSGKHTTSRVRKEVSDSVDRHDRIDSTDVVVRRVLKFVLSAGSQEELDDLCRNLSEYCRTLGLVLRRIDGEYEQLPEFESAISVL